MDRMAGGLCHVLRGCGLGFSEDPRHNFVVNRCSINKIELNRTDVAEKGVM